MKPKMLLIERVRESTERKRPYARANQPKTVNTICVAKGAEAALTLRHLVFVPGYVPGEKPKPFSNRWSSRGYFHIRNPLRWGSALRRRCFCHCGISKDTVP